MRILILLQDDYPHIGGKSTHITNILEGYKQNGSCAEILCQNCVTGFLFNISRVILFPVRCISKYLYKIAWYKLVLRLYSKKILKLCSQKQFDIINPQDAFSAVACFKVKEKYYIPIVITMHTYFGIENTLDNGVPINSKLYKHLIDLEKSSLYIADGIIAVDKRIKKHISDSCKQINLERKIIINSVPNFTNTELFRPISDFEIRKNYHIKNDEFVIICVRRLVEKNGVIFAVKAIQMIPPEFKVKLLILGDGPEKSRIKTFIEQNNIKDKVILCGSISNSILYKYYAASDCAVIPSVTVNGLQEATSISALEAMSCGLPVIASNIGGLRELISDGQNGILVEEADSPTIKNKIVELYTNPNWRYEIGIKARNSVIEEYSHIAAAKKYLSIFMGFTYKVKENEKTVF